MHRFGSNVVLIASLVLTACQAKTPSVRVGPESEPTAVLVPIPPDQRADITNLCGTWVALPIVEAPEIASDICVADLTSFAAVNGGLPESKPISSSGGTVFEDFAEAQDITNQAVDRGAIDFADGDAARSALQRLLHQAAQTP